MIVLSSIILLCSALLEGFISLPLLLIALLTLMISLRSQFVLLVGFLLGLVLDLITLRPLGETSIFLCAFLLLILIYERKFETRTYAFVIFATIIGCASYSLLFGPTNILMQILLSVFFSSILFTFLSLLTRSEKGILLT